MHSEALRLVEIGPAIFGLTRTINADELVSSAEA